MLTVKLTDDEMAALRALAAGRPMSDLVRDWIRGGRTVYTPPGEADTLGLDTTGGHAVDRVDTSTKARPIVAEGSLGAIAAVQGIHRSSHVPRPSFLAAPDDDCAACGHDRQFYHLGDKCSYPMTTRARCGCPAFVDSAEPF